MSTGHGTHPLSDAQRPRVGPLPAATYDACRRIGRCVTDVDRAVRASIGEGCQHYRPTGNPGALAVVHPAHVNASWIAVALLEGWLETHPAAPPAGGP